MPDHATFIVPLGYVAKCYGCDWIEEAPNDLTAEELAYKHFKEHEESGDNRG